MAEVTNGMTRRALLRALGLLGLSGLAGPGSPRTAHAQAQGPGNLASLGPEESVDVTMKRLFGGRAIKDGTSAIKLELPIIAENGAVVPVEVTSNLPDTKSIVVLVEKNPFPLVAKFDFLEGATPFVKVNVKMGESSNVRVLAEAGGKYYSAVKEVKVTIGGCGG